MRDHSRKRDHFTDLVSFWKSRKLQLLTFILLVWVVLKQVQRRGTFYPSGKLGISLKFRGKVNFWTFLIPDNFSETAGGTRREQAKPVSGNSNYFKAAQNVSDDDDAFAFRRSQVRLSMTYYPVAQLNNLPPQ